MDSFQALALALIQGVTEFLPASSSAHLILPSQLLGWPDQGLAFDVAVHGHAQRLPLAAAQGRHRPHPRRLGKPAAAPSYGNGRLAMALVLATLPVVLVGFTLKH